MKAAKFEKILKTIQGAKDTKFTEKEDEHLGLFADECITSPTFKKMRTKKKER